jgi:uncharacterized membrane protein
MKTLEKIVIVYLVILLTAMYIVGVLSLLYGSALSIEAISYPVLPIADMTDISLRLGGLATIAFLTLALCKKDIALDWGCKAEYV